MPAMLSAMRDHLPKASWAGPAQTVPRGDSGPGRPGRPDRLESRRRYITELLRHQHALEIGGLPMQPRDYRVLSKRLRRALAGLPEAVARGGFSGLPLDLLPLATEVLETRHFDHHGELFGLRAPMCRVVADTLLQRLRYPPAD